MNSLQEKHSSAVILFGIGLLGTMAALFSYDGWLLIASVAFLWITLGTMATVPVQRVPFTWQFGIPAYYCLLLFFLPVLNRTRGELPLNVTDTEIASAFIVLGAGILSFTAGAKLCSQITSGAPVRKVSEIAALEVLEQPWALWVLILFGLASTVWSYLFGYFGLIGVSGSESGTSAAAISAISFFVTIAHVCAWTCYLKGRGRQFLVIGIASTIVMVASGLISNSKGQVILPFVLTAISYWGVTEKVPFRQALAGLLIYLLFAYPLITSMRSGLLSADADSSRVDLAAQTIEFLFSGEWISDNAGSSATASLGRGLLEYFTQIVNESGKNVEYFYGETFLRGFEIFTPRFIDPDKPDMNIGNWTAQAFGLLHPLDNVTNVSPTCMGEFYMNFGFAGVVAGMFLMGIAAVLVDRYIIGDRGSWTMPLMMVSISWQESFFGHTILPFVKSIAILVPMIFAFNAVLSLQEKRRPMNRTRPVPSTGRLQ